MKIIIYAKHGNPEREFAFIKAIEEHPTLKLEVGFLVRREKTMAKALFKGDDVKSLQSIIDGITTRYALFYGLSSFRENQSLIELCEQHAHKDNGWKVIEFDPSTEFIFEDDSGVELIYKR